MSTRRTFFADDLRIYLYLWPVWWVLGVEQVLLPLFLTLEVLRLILRRSGRLVLNGTCVFAILLAGWWLVPIAWVEPDHLAVFLKEAVTAWSQVLILILLSNEVLSLRDWESLQKGLVAVALFVAVGGLVYGVGLWRGEMTSALGTLLPEQLVGSSEFFNSIAVRSFGEEIPWEEAGSRYSSFALNFSGLSLVCVLLLPLMIWRASRSGLWMLGFLGIIVGLVVSLVGSRSRAGVLAFFVGATGGLAWFAMRRLSPSLKVLSAATMVLVVAGVIGAHIDAVQLWFEQSFFEMRPESWAVRSRIYRQTLRMLGEHPIAGWGQPVEIAGLRKVYSAGTHSSYLGMLFQHGAVGLILYLGLLASVWRRILRGLRNGEVMGAVDRRFWLAVAVGLLSFNIREAADSWWWDQLVTVSVWTSWGLVIGAAQSRSPRTI